MNTRKDGAGGRQSSSGPTGAFVVLVGPDGAGKTTLARALIDRYEVDGAYFHFIPHPVARLSERPPDHQELVTKARRSASQFLGILRIGRSVGRAWLGYLLAIRPAVRAGKLVVGDRWLYGYMAQPAALKFHGPRWVARFVLNLVPEPDLIALLEAPAQAIHQRKPELTMAEIREEAGLWASIDQAMLHLDATLDPDTLAKVVLAHLRPPTQFVRYPPTLGHVLLPASSRSAASSASSLYAPSHRRAYFGHRAGRWLIRSLGTGWLPRVRHDRLPLDPEHWTALVGALKADGIRLDDVALYTRTQQARREFSLLAIADGEPVAFVRVGRRETLDTECDAIAGLQEARPSAFDFPRLLTRGSIGAADFAAFTPVLRGLHRPAVHPPIDAVAAQVSAGLAAIPQQGDTPDHWQPMHGDLTPWNLRLNPDGALALVDWESAGWGPPQADETLFYASSMAVGLRTSPRLVNGEAVRFWLDRIEPSSDGRDARLAVRLRRALESLVE